MPRAAAIYSSADDSNITDKSAGKTFGGNWAGAAFVGEVSWCDGGRGMTTLGCDRGCDDVCEDVCCTGVCCTGVCFAGARCTCVCCVGVV